MAMGLDAPAPGSLFFHTRFVVELHVSGKPVWGDVPAPLGPRNRIQSSATARLDTSVADNTQMTAATRLPDFMNGTTSVPPVRACLHNNAASFTVFCTFLPLWIPVLHFVRLLTQCTRLVAAIHINVVGETSVRTLYCCIVPIQYR